MKKCPFCEADIEESARFCLYCMKPLKEKEVIPPPKEKHRRWIPAVVGILLILLILGLFWLLSGPKKPKDTETVATGGVTEPLNTPETGLQSTESTENTTPTEVPSEPTPTEAETTEPAPTEPAPTEPEPTETNPTQPEVTEPQAVYTYRTAQPGDEYNVHYQNDGNDIVITGIEKESSDGIYDIPTHIDGKRVIAITANAFTGSNAGIVYIPDTIRTIWNYAFAGCSLTDVYFRGTAIYVEKYAFSGSFTLHCSADCNDRNYRYFKDSAPSYGAAWQEWNG